MQHSISKKILPDLRRYRYRRVFFFFDNLFLLTESVCSSHSNIVQLPSIRVPPPHPPPPLRGTSESHFHASPSTKSSFGVIEAGQKLSCPIEEVTIPLSTYKLLGPIHPNTPPEELEKKIARLRHVRP